MSEGQECFVPPRPQMRAPPLNRRRSSTVCTVERSAVYHQAEKAAKDYAELLFKYYSFLSSVHTHIFNKAHTFQLATLKSHNPLSNQQNDTLIFCSVTVCFQPAHVLQIDTYNFLEFYMQKFKIGRKHIQ